jgi:endonuclease IV
LEIALEKDIQETAGDKAHSKFKPNHFSLGVTIGRDQKVSEVDYYKRQGLNTFQLMVDYDKRGNIRPLPRALSESLEGTKIILHMPFYFHLLLEWSHLRRKYFTNLNNLYGKKSNKVKVIIHCKGIHKPLNITKGKIYSMLRSYARICPGLILCLENDAGGKTNVAPKLRTLASIVSSLKHAKTKNVGLCVDTQHAYAAGDELFSIDFKQSADIVHLNAIPKFIKFGGHLDRHSETRLIESKRGLNFANKILRTVRPKTPIILERTNHEVVKSDIKTVRSLINALTIEDVDKKVVCKTLPAKAPSLYRERSHI